MMDVNKCYPASSPYGDDDGTDDGADDAGDDDYDDGYDDDDSGRGILLNPPPSVSTTPFPTSTAEHHPPFSLRVTCAAAPKKRTVAFSASQVSLPASCFASCSLSLLRALTKVDFSTNDAAQEIVGVSFSDYEDNKAAYEKTFKQTIASAVSGATEDSVTDLVVTDPSATAAIALIPTTFIKRLLSGSSITITYTVTVTGTTLSVDALMGNLVTAVESGSFTAAMQSFAADNGADGLETASSDSVTTESEDDDGAATLSTGGIIGIAVGGGVLVIALVVFAVMYCRSAKREQVVVPN
jgi:hypothetical protein